jgi:hypothetical protein
VKLQAVMESGLCKRESTTTRSEGSDGLPLTTAARGRSARPAKVGQRSKTVRRKER